MTKPNITNEELLSQYRDPFEETGAFLPEKHEKVNREYLMKVPGVKKDAVHYIAFGGHAGYLYWGDNWFNHMMPKGLMGFIKLARKYKGFKYLLEIDCYTLRKMKEDGKWNRELKVIRDAIRDGLLEVVGGTYSMPYAQFISGESNVRQFVYGKEIVLDVLGQDVVSFACQEMLPHAQIPQLLKGVGIRYASTYICWPVRGEVGRVYKQKVWWKGMDGSLVETSPSYKKSNYYIMDRLRAHQFLMEMAKYGIKKTLSVGIPDCRIEAGFFPLVTEKMIRWNISSKHIRYTTLKDYFKDTPKPQGIWKSKPEDFHWRMPSGLWGDRVQKQINDLETLVLNAERFYALSKLFGNADGETQIRDAWEDLMVMQHHDMWITRLMNDTGDTWYNAGKKDAQWVLKKSFRFIHQGIGLQQKRKKISIVVWNPLPFTRKELVTIIEPNEGKTMHFYADIPPLGYKVYDLAKVATTKRKHLRISTGRLQIENDFYFIKIGKCGTITTLTDKKTGANIIDADSNVFTGYDIKNNRWINSTKGNHKINLVESGDDATTILAENHYCGIKQHIRISIEKTSRLIKFDVETDFGKKGKLIGDDLVRFLKITPEQALSRDWEDNIRKFRVDFFPAFKNKKTYQHIPFGYFAWEKQNPYEIYICNKWEFTTWSVNSMEWLAQSDGKWTFVHFNTGNYGYYVNGKCLSNVFGYGGKYPIQGEFCKKGTLPLIEEMRQTLVGIHRSRYAIAALNTGFENSGILKMHQEYNFPLLSYYVGGTRKNFSDSESFISLDADTNVICSAIFSQGQNFYVRIAEGMGKKRNPVWLKWKFPVRRCSKVDFLGRAEQTIQINKKENGVLVQLGPFQIMTLCFEIGAGGISLIDRGKKI
ncbi:MAG: hypothetical protein HY606_08140 [Planctomycetes bacterium]|nr:hypothetical protein [Planctomycetota bacterium]